MPGWTLEDVRALLGQDLAEGTLRDVVAELKHIQEGHDVTRRSHPDELLQGDIYGGVPVVIRADGRVDLQQKRVMLVSNSCDVAKENSHDLPVSLTVAPVLRLERFRQMLLDSGVAVASVDSMIQSLQVQELSTMLYIPAGPGVAEPMVVMLSEVQAMLIDEFQAAGPSRDAVLSARGFWLLLLKLAMHFCRPYEGVDRNINDAPVAA